MTVSDFIQLAAVLVAVGASIVALSLGAADRANARRIARQERAEALRDAQLLFEQQQLVRLLENARRGGSTDPLERDRLGAEAAGIIGFIGKGRLPMNWAGRVLPTDEQSIEGVLNDETKPEWIRRSAEVQIALGKVTDEIRSRLAT